ncbi:MAG: hypothetical protein DWI48_00390 [Chloroflexi bacterium]|nr:MAG: hypothetical protein DWI48_00390 [Chloroflexota bacterium]
MNTTILALHVLLAVMLVGPQFLLFFAVIPATWLIPDEQLRRDVTRVVTSRFGMMSAISIVGLVITGLYMLNSSLVGTDVRDHMMEYRFGAVFGLKMLTFIILLVAIGVHGAVFGRRIRATSEAVERGEVDPGELERARRNSLMFSMIILLLSVAVLFMGVTLGNHDYSMQPMQ